MIENGKRWVLQCLTPNQPPHTTFLKRSIISFFFILNSLISSSSISNYQRNLVAKRQIHFLKFADRAVPSRINSVSDQFAVTVRFQEFNDSLLVLETAKYRLGKSSIMRQLSICPVLVVVALL